MTLSDPETLARFQALRQKLTGFINGGLHDYEAPVMDWRRAAQVIIKEHFSEDSEHAHDFRRCFSRAGVWGPEYAATHARASRESLSRAGDLLDRVIEEIEAYWQPTVPERHNRISTSENYVCPSRIDELSSLSGRALDPLRLVALCRELNTAWHHGCNYSVVMLVRTIVDHIPPVFGYSSFSEFANNYAGGKSFKDIMLRLDQVSRKIADRSLHQQIRHRESELTATQVNFASELDVLLQEVIVKLT